MTERLADILLVEDDPEDADLTRETLLRQQLYNRLHVVQDGDEAMRFLRREGDHAEAPRPDLMILDMSLPRMNGREVLAEVKADEELRSIPVVVLTSSENEEIVQQAYDLFANCYVVKPVDLKQYIEVVKSIENFWIKVVSLCPE